MSAPALFLTMRYRSLHDWLLRVQFFSARRSWLPRGLNFVGGEQFYELGRGHFENIRAIARARRDDRVLDVGCGVGRVARHFVDFLDERGRYDGFDAVRIGVDWCNARIARQRGNVRFVHANVHNQQYNPRGELDAASFTFPYDDESFSLVFATSVLTHLLPNPAAQYLKEIARVLKVGGRSVVTFFIINDESLRHMDSSTGLFFHDAEQGFWTTQLHNPEAAVAFEERTILRLYQQAGLEIQQPIRYGNWSGREGTIGGQDHILAIKRGPSLG